MFFNFLKNKRLPCNAFNIMSYSPVRKLDESFHLEHNDLVFLTRIGKVAPPINYRRLTLLLEVVQSRKRVKDSESLVARLFALLNR